MELLNRIPPLPKMVYWLKALQKSYQYFWVEQCDCKTLTQWFPTRVSQHIRVLFRILMGATL